MSDACSAVGQGSGFVSSITGYVDCQAQTLGSGAWAALSTPGSTLQIVLTGFLTIFIALIGYNLLLGRSLTVRSGTLAFVKIGAVFALATSWPAYRTVVYDLVTDGPGQLVSEIGPRAGVVGSDGTLLQRLDQTDQAFVQMSILGPGYVNPGPETQIPPPPFAGFDAFALGGSRMIFLVTAIGGLAVIRAITGLMLALGPFFIAFLLFDGTRSLFEGWVRVLAGTALAAVGVSIALGLELALLEPWLSAALARRMAGEALPSLSVELFVIACLFALIVIAALYACTRTARAFRLPAIVRLEEAETPLSAQRTRSRSASGEAARSRAPQYERTRAEAVAGIVHSTMLRERAELIGAGAPATGIARAAQARSSDVEPGRRTVPLGKSFRRGGARVSATATKRDKAE
jgi:type IV secretion system protein VirB6